MNIKVDFALYAGVRREPVNDSQWITATPQALCGDCSAPPATETFLDTSETSQKPSSVRPSISDNRLLFRC